MCLQDKPQTSNYKINNNWKDKSTTLAIKLIKIVQTNFT